MLPKQISKKQKTNQKRMMKNQKNHEKMMAKLTMIEQKPKTSRMYILYYYKHFLMASFNNPVKIK